jgi:hypothetical protein
MKKLIALLCFAYAGTAAGLSAGVEIGGGGGIGGSGSGQVLYNNSNSVDGSPNMTFDGSKLTVADLDILPDDGNNGIYLDDNPTAAGGYDCVTNAPATGDMILNVDSDDESGALFACLPDGVNYEFPKFDASTLLSCPGCDWTIDNTGVVMLKNMRFHSAAKDISIEFARFNVAIAGTGVASYNPIVKISPGVTNGVDTFTENVERFRIDPLNGVEIRSGDTFGGGASTLKFWDLDNTTGSISLAVPDTTAAEYTNTLASNDGTVLTDESRVGVTITAATTLSPTADDLTNGRFIANHASGTDYSLPAVDAGIDPCFYDLDGTVGITIDAEASDRIRLPDGTLLDPGYSIVSTTANAIGDFICLLGIDGTNWVSLSSSGTWTDGGP